MCNRQKFTCNVKEKGCTLLKKSKILNCLFCETEEFHDWEQIVREALQQPNPDDSTRLPNSSSAFSVLDILDKHFVWNSLSVPSTEDDGCEYCTIQPIEMQLFPKHQIYTNGNLTCPVLLALKTSKHLNQTNSMKISAKKGGFKGAKRNT